MDRPGLKELWAHNVFVTQAAKTLSIAGATNVITASTFLLSGIRGVAFPGFSAGIRFFELSFRYLSNLKFEGVRLGTECEIPTNIVGVLHACQWQKQGKQAKVETNRDVDDGLGRSIC
jgi:hypothetical protein